MKRCGRIDREERDMRRLVSVAVGTAMFFAVMGPAAAAHEPPAACWGQATKVFAQMGEMGDHSSEQPTPRLGLRNLARALADAGVLPDDSMASLGAFVAAELGLTIDACMS
jgi:hypothetical protein